MDFIRTGITASRSTAFPSTEYSVRDLNTRIVIRDPRPCPVCSLSVVVSYADEIIPRRQIQYDLAVQAPTKIVIGRKRISRCIEDVHVHIDGIADGVELIHIRVTQADKEEIDIPWKRKRALNQTDIGPSVLGARYEVTGVAQFDVYIKGRIGSKMWREN